jgi:signal peptidase I
MNIRTLITNPRSRRTLLALLLLIATVQYFRSSVGTFSIVEGVSMYPTFLPNDVVQARALHAEVQRGDVVIVADDQGEEVIKRVIGLPGEAVTLYRGFVYVNRLLLIEPYLPKFTYTYKRNQLNERAVTWQLTGNQYFVLGDNRLYSADSRHYGPIALHQIHRVVNVPPNAVRPSFSNITLSEDRRALPGKYSQHVHTKSRPPNNSQGSNARS